MSTPADTLPENNRAFVATPLDIQCDLPAEVIPEHILRKATEAEIDSIRGILLPRMANTPYEYSREQSSNLPRDKWLYYVIEVRKEPVEHVVGGDIHDICRVTRLTKCGLEMPIHLYAMGIGITGWIGTDLFPATRMFERYLVDNAMVKEWNETWELVANLKRQEPQCPEYRTAIGRAIDLFHHVGAVPKLHPLYILGTFAVLELILTHRQSTDYDSIGHQLRQKAVLLDRRMLEKADYSSFTSSDPQKIWPALYDCRSRIAHGGELDFKERKMKILVEMKNVQQFLTEYVRLVLQHALREPDLVLDLKRC